MRLNKIDMKKGIKFLIIFFFLCLLVLPIFAQNINEATGLIVSPPTLSEEITKGSVVRKSFRIINQRSTDEKIYIYTRDLENSPQVLSQSYVLEEDLSPSVLENNNWLDLSKAETFLRVGESDSVEIEINLPQSLTTQGFYFELVFSTSEPNSSRNAVSLIPEVAVPVSLNYFGSEEEKRGFEILSFYAKSDSELFSTGIHEYLPVSFHSTIKNTGNINLIPTGNIFISSDSEFASKNIVENILLNPNKLQIFSLNQREFQNSWSNSLLTLESGKLNVNFGNEIRFGRLYAQLSIVWEGTKGKSFLTREVSFWVIPWKLIFCIIVIIVLFILFIRRFKLPKLINEKPRKQYKRVDYSPVKF